MTHYSQDGQDRWLDENVFQGKRDGVFAEIGAYDGIGSSNTLFFERERGWRGLLVEANSDYVDTLRRERPLATIIVAAAYDRDGEVTLNVVSAMLGWSGIANEIEPQHAERCAQYVVRQRTVRCLPLARMFEVAGLTRVDYLSLDVEGAEAAVLRAFPFAEFPVDVIGVENSWHRPEIDAILLPAGYEKIGRVGSDDFYRRAA